MPANLRVLVVEDNDTDVFLLREAVSTHNLQVDLHVVETGEGAVAYIDAIDADADAPRPTMCVLDINIPTKNGRAVLRHIRKSRRLGTLPVIVMTSSESATDRAEMLNLGANACFHKPISYSDFLKIGGLMGSFLEERGRF